MTDHPHIATRYEIEALAQQRLKAIVLPLLPKYVEYFWQFKDEAEARGFGNIPYSEGDRIYLQEPWCKGDWEAAFDDDIYFTESTTPEAENIGWQPVSTMPIEAAQHWFEISGVRVCPCKDLDLATLVDSGIAPQPLIPHSKMTERWNAAYPGQPWQGDRWMVILEVEAVSPC